MSIDQLIEAVERFCEKQDDFNVVEKLSETIEKLKEVKYDLNNNPS